MKDYREVYIDKAHTVAYLLRKWRPALLGAVLIAIAAALISVALGLATLSTDREIYADKHEEYDADLARYNANLVNYAAQIEDLDKKIEIQQAYLDHSILMKLDANSVLETCCDISVTSVGGSTMKDILDSLYKQVTEGTDWEAVGKILSLDAEYARETIAVTKNSDSERLSIVCYVPSEENAKAVMEQVLNDLNSSMQILNSGIDKFTTMESDLYTRTIVDNDIAVLQSEANGRISSYQSELDTVLDLQENAAKPDGIGAMPSYTKIAKTAIKVGAIAFVMGGIFVLLCFHQKFISAVTISYRKEIEDLFDIPVLGAFTDIRRKGLFHKLDNLSERIDHPEHPKSAEEILRYIAANLALRVPEGAAVLLVGGERTKSLGDTAVHLGAILPDIMVSSADNMLGSANALEQLANADYVVLAVLRDKTSTASIKSLRELCESASRPVVGSIIF